MVLLGNVIHDYGYVEPGSYHDLDFFPKIAYPVQNEDLQAVYSAEIRLPASQQTWTYRQYYNRRVGGVARLFWRILMKDHADAESAWGVLEMRMLAKCCPRVFLRVA